jgi:hypothetical protein
MLGFLKEIHLQYYVFWVDLKLAGKTGPCMTSPDANPNFYFASCIDETWKSRTHRVLSPIIVDYTRFAPYITIRILTFYYLQVVTPTTPV